MQRLLRRSNDSVIAGVCGGLAEWLGWKPDRVRLAYVVLSILSGGFSGLVVYLILWFLMPASEPEPC